MYNSRYIYIFLHQLTVQGAVSPHPRPPVAYNCCVSVLPSNARIDPTTQQLIGETCTCRYSSTSATGCIMISCIMKYIVALLIPLLFLCTNSLLHTVHGRYPGWGWSAGEHCSNPRESSVGHCAVERETDGKP